MNLKGFHIAFVTVSSLMCFVSSGIYGSAWMDGGGNADLVPAAGWFLGGIALVYYGIYFLRKFRDWGYY